MKGIQVILTVMLAFAMIPGFTAGDSAPPSPAGVVAVSVGPIAVISWTPSTDAVGVTYHVYGFDGSGLVLLDTTDFTTAPVVGGYVGYAVSAVNDAGESEPTYASAGICIRVSPDQIPPVDVWECAHLA